MTRKRRTARVISRRGEHWVDRTVIAICGGDQPFKQLKEVIHGRYFEVAHLTQEQLDAGVQPPRYDVLTYDSFDFSSHFLRKAR